MSVDSVWSGISPSVCLSAVVMSGTSVCPSAVVSAFPPSSPGGSEVTVSSFATSFVGSVEVCGVSLSPGSENPGLSSSYGKYYRRREYWCVYVCVCVCVCVCVRA